MRRSRAGFLDPRSPRPPSSRANVRARAASLGSLGASQRLLRVGGECQALRPCVPSQAAAAARALPRRASARAARGVSGPGTDQDTLPPCSFEARSKSHLASAALGRRSISTRSGIHPRSARTAQKRSNGRARPPHRGCLRALGRCDGGAGVCGDGAASRRSGRWRRSRWRGARVHGRRVGPGAADRGVRDARHGGARAGRHRRADGAPPHGLREGEDRRAGGAGRLHPVAGARGR